MIGMIPPKRPERKIRFTPQAPGVVRPFTVEEIKAANRILEEEAEKYYSREEYSD